VVEARYPGVEFLEVWSNQRWCCHFFTVCWRS